MSYGRDGGRRPAADIRGSIRAGVLGLAAAIGLMVLSAAWYTVDANEKAVVLRFGRYLATSDPGLHFCIPLVDRVYKADMRERTMRLPVNREEGAAAVPMSDDALMLTGDLNAAAVEWSLQWRVDDPVRYLFTFHHDRIDHDVYMEQIVSVVARSVMNRLVGDYSFDEVLTQKRSEIGRMARDATQSVLDQYQCGVTISDLQMQRITPPESVRSAFAAVNAAVQTRDRFINEARTQRNAEIPRARAERDRLIQEAQGYADRRRAEVRGEIDALRARYEQFARAPEETRQRMYLESLESVLSSVEQKMIIDADLQQVLPLLNLNEEKD